MDLSDEKNIKRAFPTRLSLCTYPTLVKNLLSLEQSLLSPKKNNDLLELEKCQN